MEVTLTLKFDVQNNSTRYDKHHTHDRTRIYEILQIRVLSHNSYLKKFPSAHRYRYVKTGSRYITINTVCLTCGRMTRPCGGEPISLVDVKWVSETTQALFICRQESPSNCKVLQLISKLGRFISFCHN